MSSPEPEPTTTDAGIPVASQEHSLTVGPDGPILLNDFYLIEQMANFNRERIPERQPHAKGSGAFGYFQVTGDVSRYTRAAVFQPEPGPIPSPGSPPSPGSEAAPTRGATRAGSRCGSTPARATWTSSGTTRRCSSCATP